MRINNRINVAALLLITAAAMTAAPLTPEQALSAARSQVAVKGMRAPGSQMELVYTVDRPDSSEPAVYVFTGDDGFIVASADDACTPLLGFSTDSRLDVNDLPPSFVWWMQGYAAYVAQQADNSLRPAGATLLKDKKLSTPAKAPALSTARTSIAPLLNTSWNQDAPYYDQCPVINGRHAYTGCVATAMAQVMNVHRWPVAGKGSKTYTFNYNGVDYTDSFDFAATTFDWDHMSSGYGDQSSQEARTAVATLMHACGVAANMSYGLEGSGANSLRAAGGLITYLDYDPAMVCLERNWFEQEEWNDMVYAELAAGRPVYYGGDDGSNGHAFVCDGYASGERFHINWGWGGNANGYFLLNALSPSSQGIGGGTGADGYNYNQDAFFGMQKPKEGSAITPIMALYSDFSTDRTTYTRNSTTGITFQGEIYSFSAATVDVIVGYKLVYEDGTVEYITQGNASLNTYAGFNSMQIAASRFPVGSYDVYPAYKGGNVDWRADYYLIGMVNPYVHFEATDSQITVTSASTPSGDVELSASLKSYDPVNGTDEGFYPGHSYYYTFNVTATGAWSGVIDCLFYNTAGNILSYDEKMVSFAGAATKTDTWTVEIPADTEPGEYRLGLYTYDSSAGLSYLVAYRIDITAAPEGNVVSVTAVNSALEGEKGEAAIYPGHSYIAGFGITSTGVWDHDVYCMLLSRGDNGLSIVDEGESQRVTFTQAGTQVFLWTLAIPADVTPGEYVMALVYEDGGSLKVMKNSYNIQIVEEPVTEPAVEVTYVAFDGIERDGTETVMLEDDAVEIEIGLKCTRGTWTYDIEAVFLDEDDAELSRFAAEPVILGEGEETATTVALKKGDIPTERDLKMAVYGNNEALSAPIPVYMKSLTAIDLIKAASTGNVTFYNLQGMRIDKPAAGCYIRVAADGTTEKVFVK